MRNIILTPFVENLQDIMEHPMTLVCFIRKKENSSINILTSSKNFIIILPLVYTLFLEVGLLKSVFNFEYFDILLTINMIFSFTASL